MSYRLAEQMGLPDGEKKALLLEGLVHDIGAVSIHERLALIEKESDLNSSVHKHAFRGAKILDEFEPFRPMSDAVRYHHVPWDNGNGRKFRGRDVPLESHLLHLADRTCILIKNNHEILIHIPDILDEIQKERNNRFMPQAVDALTELGKKEYIWLELSDNAPLDFLKEFTSGIEDVDLNGAVGISHLFSHVVDFRSHFTATHSAGVAKTAQKLGELAGLSEEECKMLLIAGYLHDLGKLTIPNTVLEKPSKLDNREYGIMRGHSFYTYRLLGTIRGFDTINRWASFHHEHIDGTGYPYHLKGAEIPLGSRIVAVADVFTAITEQRPYRKGMEKRQIVDILQKKAGDGTLCPEVVKLLLDQFEPLTEICRDSQKEVSNEFAEFLNQDIVSQPQLSNDEKTEKLS